MFDPKVVRAQTNEAPSLIHGLGQQHSRFAQITSSPARDQADGWHKRQIDPEGAATQDGMYGIARDFSTISIFPPETTSQPHTTLLPLPSAIYPMLTVGKANDPLEVDADRVAERVMRMPDPKTCIGAESPWASRTPQTKPARASAEFSDEAASMVHEISDQAGQPLPAATRTFFESAMGHDFSRVRVHTDARAAASARAVNALAYTVGHDVVFADGRYAPHASAGRLLLAHELAHVRQVEGGQLAGKRNVLRKPAGAKETAAPQPGKVKELVELNDPTANHELSQLIDGNPLNGKPAVCGVLEKDSRTYRFALKVEFRGDLDLTGEIKGKTLKEEITKAGEVEVHTIPIVINKVLHPSEEEAKRHPDLQERLNYMAADTLLHELIHARINIDHSLASIGVSKLSNVRAELLTLQAQAHLPAAAIEREALRTRLTSLLTTASNAVGKPLLKGADVSSYAEDTINDLIEEKYAKQTSGRAFGMKQSISNKEVAHAYKNKVERLVINMASDINAAKAAALKVNNIWVFNNLPELESAIVAFYNKLDEIAAPAATAAAAGAAVGTAIGGGAASSVTGNQPGTAPMP